MFFKNLEATLENSLQIRDSVERILNVNPKLNHNEAIAIAQYIGPYRREINQHLIGLINKEWITDCHFYLNNAIKNKMSKFNLNLILKRDIRVSNPGSFILSNFLFENTVYESDHFMAFTYDLSYDHYVGNVQYICTPLRDGKSSGVEMDLYKKQSVEHEVLFPLGTRFLVEKIEVGTHGEIPKKPKYKLVRDDAKSCYQQFVETKKVPQDFKVSLKVDRINLEKMFNLYTEDVIFIYLKEI